MPIRRQRECIHRVRESLALPVAAHEQREAGSVVEFSSARIWRRPAVSGAKTVESTPLETLRTAPAMLGKRSRSSAATPLETARSRRVRLGR